MWKLASLGGRSTKSTEMRGRVVEEGEQEEEDQRLVAGSMSTEKVEHDSTCRSLYVPLREALEGVHV